MENEDSKGTPRHLVDVPPPPLPPPLSQETQQQPPQLPPPPPQEEQKGGNGGGGLILQPPPGQQQQQQQQQQHNQKRASKTQSVIVTTAPQIPGAASPLKGSARIRRKSLIVTGKDQQQQPQQARRHRASSNFHGGLSSAASFSGGPNCANDDDLWEPPPPVVKLFQDEFSVMTALEKARAAMYEPSASVIFTDFISQLEAGAHTATSSTIPAATTPKSTAEKSSQKGSAYNTPIPEAFVTQSNFAPVASVDFFADPVPQNLSINPVPFQTCYGNDTGDDKKKKVTPRGVKDEDEDNSEDGEDEISKTFSKRPGHTQSAIAMSLRSTNNGSSNTTTSNTNAAMAAGSNGNRRGKPGLITSKDEKEEDGNSNTTGGDEDGSKCTLEKPKCIHEVDPETQMAIVQPVVLKSLLTEEIKAYDAVQEKLQKKHKYIVTLPPDYNTKVTIELTEAGTILNAVSEVLRTYKAGPVILKNAPDAYVLYMADDAGLPETDFPAPDVTRRIIDMQCSTFALYENPNYDAPIVLEIKVPPEAKKSGGRISIPIKRGKTVKQVLHEVCKKLGLKSSRYELQMEIFPVPLSLQTTIDEIGATELALVRTSGSDESKKESNSSNGSLSRKRRSMAVTSDALAAAAVPHSYQVARVPSKHGRHKAVYTMDIDAERLLLTPLGSEDGEGNGSSGFRLGFKSRKTAKVFKVSDIVEVGAISDRQNGFFVTIGEDHAKYEFESVMKPDILSQLKILMKKKERDKTKDKEKSK